MRIRLGNGLLPLNIVVWLFVAAILLIPFSNTIRIIIGIPLVLLLPGYAVVTALFPKRTAITGIERVGLSFGISIVVVPIIGIILNYTPWGITLQSISYSIVLFIFIFSFINWLSLCRLKEDERFRIQFQLRLPYFGTGTWDKMLSVILVVSIIGTLGIMTYLIVRPNIGERFSEFYILGLEGKAADYPSHLVVGQEGKVIVGIANSEQEAVSYRLKVMIDGIINNDITGILLEEDEKWEKEISFIPQKVAHNQKLEFFLYKDEEIEPCVDPLHLWIDVREQ